MMLAAAYAPSYSLGQRLLREIGGIPFSGRGLNKIAVKIGTELATERDARTAAYFEQPLLGRRGTKPQTPIQLASVSIDGGRMQTRDEQRGPGVYHPHWRENKNALFSRMSSEIFVDDPHPELPGCFADRQRMKQLLSGVVKNGAANVPRDAEPAEQTSAIGKQDPSDDHWRPERLFRTCLSSLHGSDDFGRTMEAEADARGFYQAQKKAFVCDGLPYNWTIQQRHFQQFTPILDFVHAVERMYEAARSVHVDVDCRWEAYLRWTRAAWRGEIEQVLPELRTHQQQLGLPPADCEQTDPRKILADAIGYFENNAARMKYPEYRQQGLPVTSAHMESLVKEINTRVKGTEKFWTDGASGEAILQIRAAVLGDDGRLASFLHKRPGSPFHPNVRRQTSLALAP